MWSDQDYYVNDNSREMDYMHVYAVEAILLYSLFIYTGMNQYTAQQYSLYIL